MKPTLYIMCGLPFSGKTILAQKISDKLGYPIVSIDTIREEHGFTWEENEKVIAKDWEEIFNESYSTTSKHLKSGQSVIYDSANQDRISRDKLRKLAEKSNANTKVIFLDVHEEEIRRRWAENQVTKERFHLPEKYLQAAIDTLEKPLISENVVNYNQNMNLNEITNQLIKI